MDASSIITQVSRDDELGAFNSEKGVYHVNRPRHPTPPPPAFVMLSARCCRDFVPLHLLRYPHPRFSPRPMLPNFISRLSSRLLREQLLACLSCCSPLPPYFSYFSPVLPSFLNPCHPASCVLRAMSQIFSVPYAISCPLTFHAPFMRSSLRASCKEDSKKLTIKG